MRSTYNHLFQDESFVNAISNIVSELKSLDPSDLESLLDSKVESSKITTHRCQMFTMVAAAAAGVGVGSHGCAGRDGLAGLLSSESSFDSCEDTDLKRLSTTEQAAAKVEHQKLLQENQRLLKEKNAIESAITTLAQAENRDLCISLEKEKIINKTMLANLNTQCLDNASKNITECCVCMDGPRDTALFPCGHKLFCYPCIEKYSKQGTNKCPVCKVAIERFAKVFD